MIRIENTIVFVDDVKVVLPYLIEMNREVLLFNNDLIVVYDIPDFKEKRNVFCYSLEGKELWRIKEPPEELVGKGGSTWYVGISYIDNKVRVIDFHGRNFEMNPENGELISMYFVK